MKLDFPEETEVDEPPIFIPPVFANLLQVETLNREITATLQALIHLWAKEKQETGFLKYEQALERFADLKKLFLKELEDRFSQRLREHCGPDPKEQQKFLEANPAAILCAGEFIKDPLV